MSFFDEPCSEHIQPLITVEDEKYKVHEGTVNWLASLKKPLCILSCAGRYRSGKSFLLNCLCENENGFKVGDTVQACTKGIWIFQKPIWEDDDKVVVVMDTEGIDALDANDNHDVRIFTLALLLSSSFLYNSTGPIDESALQTLSLMTKISEFVKISNDCETTPEMLSDHMPQFYWILRDFSLQIKNRNGEPCSNASYLEEALSDQGHTEERGKVRQTVRNAFSRRTLVTLPRPQGETQNLKFSHAGHKFRAELSNLKQKILGEINPLRANDTPVSGNMFCEMCKYFVECINKPNSVPVIKDTWSLLADVQARDLEDQLLNEAEKLIGTISQTCFEYEQLQHELSKVNDSMLAKFSKQLIGGSRVSEQRFEENLGKLIQRELRVCEEKIAEKYREKVDEIHRVVTENDLDVSLLAKLVADTDRSLSSQPEKFQLASYRAIVKHSYNSWYPRLIKYVQSQKDDYATLACENEGLKDSIELTNRHLQSEVESHQKTLENLKMELKNEAEAMNIEAKLHLEHLKKENELLCGKNEEQERKLQELIVWQSMVTKEQSENTDVGSGSSTSSGQEDPEPPSELTEHNHTHDDENNEKVQKIQELEIQLRTTVDELNEMKAIRSTLVTQNNANKEAREKLEALCSSKLQQLQQKYATSIQKQRESYEENIQRLNKDLDDVRASEKNGKEEVKSLEARLASFETLMIENKAAYERELRIQKESQLTARATCEDLQERIVKMHADSLEDIRIRDASNRERQTKITEELLQSQIEKSESMRQLERSNSEISSLKRKLAEKDEIQGENKKLRQKINEFEAKFIHMKSESEFLRGRNDELVREREDIRSSLMASERKNALLEREVSIFKVENDLK